jgi:hypothetical protein
VWVVWVVWMLSMLWMLWMLGCGVVVAVVVVDNGSHSNG